MDATTDKEPLVQEQIYNALCYLGESEPEEILHSCDEYLRQHDKVGPLGLGVSDLPCRGGSGLGGWRWGAAWLQPLVEVLGWEQKKQGVPVGG